MCFVRLLYVKFSFYEINGFFLLFISMNTIAKTDCFHFNYIVKKLISIKMLFIRLDRKDMNGDFLES